MATVRSEAIGVGSVDPSKVSRSRSRAAQASVRAMRRTVYALGLLAGLGCSDLDDGASNCETLGIDPCIKTGSTDPNTPGDWSCLGETPPTLPIPDGSSSVWAGPVLDWSSRQPLTGMGLTGTLCLITPASCQPPASPKIPVMPSSILGNPVPLPAFLAPVPMMKGFDGFIRFELPSPDPARPELAYVPMSYYLGGQVVDDLTATQLAILMIRRGSLDSVIKDSFGRANVDGSQQTVDRDGAGFVVFRSVDCAGEPVSDVRFELDRPGQAIAFRLPQSRLPIAGVPGEPVYTDGLGAAGFANVSPGTYEALAFRRDEDVPYGRIQLGVVAGETSLAVIRPPTLNSAKIDTPPMAMMP
jgi:hypothetical protein